MHNVSIIVSASLLLPLDYVALYVFSTCGNTQWLYFNKFYIL